MTRKFLGITTYRDIIIEKFRNNSKFYAYIVFPNDFVRVTVSYNSLEDVISEAKETIDHLLDWCN